MSAQKKEKQRLFKMDSRKRTLEYDTLKKDDKVLSKRHKTNCVKDRRNKMKEHLKQFFKEVKDVDRVDDCLESLASYLTNPHFPNQLFAEVDAVEPKCKVSKDILHTNTSQECSSEHTQRNMIGNTPCVTKNRFETSKIQRSGYLFADTPIPIKLGINPFGGRFKEVQTPFPLNSSFNPQIPPFSSSQASKTFVPELADGNMQPVAKPMSNIHVTTPSNKNWEERKERYKPLLEKFSKTELFFSTVLPPALKTLQEWKVNNREEQDSVRSKYTLDSDDDGGGSNYDDDDDPLILDVEPWTPTELPPGMYEGKLTVKFVKELNKLLAEDFQKERPLLEERHRQISMHYEKQAANRAARRASILEKLRKERFAAGSDALDVLPELTPKMDPVFDDIVMSPNTPNQECQESTRAPLLTSPGPMTPSRGQTPHGIGPCQHVPIHLIRAPLLTSPGPMTPSRGQTPHGIGPCQSEPIDLIQAPLLTSPGPMTPSPAQTPHGIGPCQSEPIDLIQAPLLTSPGPMTPSRDQTPHGIGPCQSEPIDLIQAPLLTSPGLMTPSRGQTPHGIGPCQSEPIDLIQAPLLTSPGPMTPSPAQTPHGIGPCQRGPIDLIRAPKLLSPPFVGSVPNNMMCKFPDDSEELTLTQRDLKTLSGTNWLNDEIINSYLKLIVKRSQSPDLPSVYAFQTFFYTKVKLFGHSAVKQWTKKIDIFSFDILLVPIHLDRHWCLGVIDNRHKKVQYYDSKGGPGECLPILEGYLCAESLDKKKEFNVNDWIFETVKDIPQQLNGSDCGMFTLKYAEYITRNARITFTQKDVPYFRRKMVHELKTAKMKYLSKLKQLKF